jgi:hypothetical protein
MTTYAAPMCMACARYDRNARNLACEAYPDGIPNAILQSWVDHREPQPGDGGLRFVLADEWRGRDLLPGLLGTSP